MVQILAFDNLLDGTMVIATVTTLLSAVLLMIFAPAVFHERYEQTRVPREETRVPRN